MKQEILSMRDEKSYIYIKKMRNLKYRRWKVSGKRDCYRIICETGVRNTTAPPKNRERKKIMMTTVMALAVVAIMIAKAINVNNHIEMGK